MREIRTSGSMRGSNGNGAWRNRPLLSTLLLSVVPILVFRLSVQISVFKPGRQEGTGHTIKGQTCY